MTDSTTQAPDYDFLRAWRECRKGPHMINPHDGSTVKRGSRAYVDLEKCFEANQSLVAAYCIACGGLVSNNYCKHCSGQNDYFMPTTRAFAPTVKARSDPQVSLPMKVRRSWAAKVNSPEPTTKQSKINNLSKSAPPSTGKGHVVISPPSVRRESVSPTMYRTTKDRRCIDAKKEL